MKWYLKVLQQYADFRGRVRRKEYWMFFLFNMIFAIAAVSLDILLGIYYYPVRSIIVESGVGPIYLVYALAIVIPNLAVTVRRLHDIGKGGGWIFIGFIPIVGTIWLLVLLCTDSEVGNNRFGSNPKAS